MSDLVRTLILCGLLSGTQPLTVMGLLLVMGSDHPRRNGYVYLSGAFTVQISLLLISGLLLNGTVSAASDLGRSFIAVRILLGLGAVVLGVLLRRPPGKPVPEIPDALQKLQGLGPRQAFVAGIVVADYQGPVLASMALASASIGLGNGRLLAIIFFSLLATGIPVAFLIWATASDAARDRLHRATTWVMRNRRVLASWILLVVGTLLAVDGVITWMGVKG